MRASQRRERVRERLRMVWRRQAPPSVAVQLPLGRSLG
jgi:hypothetical protein